MRVFKRLKSCINFQIQSQMLLCSFISNECAKDYIIHCGNHHCNVYTALQQSFLRLAVSTQCHEACVVSISFADDWSPWRFLLKVKAVRSERSSMTKIDTEGGQCPAFFLFWFYLFVPDSIASNPQIQVSLLPALLICLNTNCSAQTHSRIK